MKAEDHVLITEAAVELYQDSCTPEISSFLKKYCNSICLGALEADSKPWWTRATNWHFFNRNLSTSNIAEVDWEKKEETLFHYSSDYILRQRDAELDTEIEKKNPVETSMLIGRLLHHVQDMTTPSHVIPVYHGIFKKDSFEKHLHNHYLNKSSINFLKTKIKDSSLSDLPEHNSVMAIYVKAAEDTLSYFIQEKPTFPAIVNSVRQELSWDIFWEPKNRNSDGSLEQDYRFDGFGKYGPLGKKFGETNVRSNGKNYQIEKDVFNELCEDLACKMIFDSILTLKSLEQRLQPLLPTSELQTHE